MLGRKIKNNLVINWHLCPVARHEFMIIILSVKFFVSLVFIDPDSGRTTLIPGSIPTLNLPEKKFPLSRLKSYLF